MHALEVGGCRGMAQQLERCWGLLEDGMSGAEVSYFSNLLGPTLAGGRVLTPDWLPTGLGSAVGKDKMPYMLSACHPDLGQLPKTPSRGHVSSS